MRFKRKGTKVVSKFAILPVKIGNEIRWLEYVKYRTTYNYWRKIWQKDYFID